jgi:site-specific recombinase XerD/post-segregation antitoxin (ccd killing protein)
MGADGNMGNRKSTCLYLDNKIVETAKRAGLNVSRVSENALVEAIARLTEPKHETGLRSPISMEGRGRDSNPGARLHRPGSVNRDRLPSDFYDFCKVDLGLAEVTAKEYRRKMRRFFNAIDKPAGSVTAEDVRAYLKPLSGGSANSYGNALKPIKRFFRDYMKMGDVVESFKFRKITLKPIIVPSKEQMREFYGALRTPRARALFLMYASTGLRKMELLSLTRDDIDWDKRMVIPNGHDGGTKRSWVTFFNHEAECALKEYLATRKDDSPKLFRVSPHSFIDIWKFASQDSGVRVTPQVLREWFCDELGRLGVPDRYVDAFCGRVPRSVLARRYSDFAPEKLLEVYGKANVKILD